MPRKPKQPDIVRTAKQIVALLAKSGLDNQQQVAAFRIAGILASEVKDV